MKSFCTQGGIRVPFIIRYPPFHAHKKYQAGQVIEQPTTVMDIAATILDLAEIDHPAGASGEAKGSFRGREVVGMKGKSWRGMFEKGDRCHDENEPLGWEVCYILSFLVLDFCTSIWENSLHSSLITIIQLHGRAGMRIGDWKITFVPPPFGPGQWQLFNLKEDPGEVFDVKDKEPEKYKDLCDAWDKYLEANGVVWGAPMPLETIDGDGLADIIDNSTGWMQPIKDN